MQEYIKILGSGHNNNITLIISKDEINDIIKIVKSFEDSGLLLKGVTEQKGGMLLGTLGASLLGNILTGKGIYRAGKGVLRAGCGRPLSSASQNNNNKMDF